ncbi:HAD family hydrolase [Candidatus Bathyarchaeota archaeon]|nr:MAG: HAD family hydrolase [Candidatus Bathyarchaeota archaeon]
MVKCEGVELNKIKAVLFDLHGTLAFVKNPVSDVELSEYLFSRGYEVSPQQLRAAWFFVSMIDYPKHGYRNWRSYFSRILWRLKVKVDKETLDAIAKLLESKPYQLYPDAAEAVIKAKQYGFKTAIVTTIAYFQFKKAIQPIKRFLDFVMTGYKAKCDKSNPKMYKKVLEILNVKPDETIMIGDNIPIDIILPKKLGIKTMLLDRERKDVKCPQADFIVNDLKEAIENIIG